MNNVMLKLWCEGLGIPVDVLEDPRVMQSVQDKDGVSGLRDLQRVLSRRGLASLLRDAQHQLEFISLVRNPTA